MAYSNCQIFIKGKKQPILNKVRVPTGFYANAKGLLGTKALAQDEAMLFRNCQSIHMFGMKIPLDIIFLAKDGTVLKMIENLKPWKIAGCFKSKMTLEMATGTIKKHSIETNMKLEIGIYTII